MKNSKFFEKNIALLLAVLLLGITVCSCRSETTTELPASGLPSGEKSSGAPTVPAESSSVGEIPASSEIPVSPSPAPSIEPTPSNLSPSDTSEDPLIPPSHIFALQTDIEYGELEDPYSFGKVLSKLKGDPIVSNGFNDVHDFRRSYGEDAPPVLVWKFLEDEIPVEEIPNLQYLFVYRKAGTEQYHHFFCSPFRALYGGMEDDNKLIAYCFPIFDYIEGLVVEEDGKTKYEMYLLVLSDFWIPDKPLINIGEYRYDEYPFFSGQLVCWNCDRMWYDENSAQLLEEMRQEK
ncbi:MAG: hypothetical protein IJZ33_02280 [Clostridia bacterium]|nr:hypothetical protein [Clostridia bacterium]